MWDFCVGRIGFTKSIDSKKNSWPPKQNWGSSVFRQKMKWWCFRPLLCTLFRLNWAKQTPGNLPLSGFELATQWSEAQHATAGLRRPPCVPPEVSRLWHGVTAKLYIMSSIHDASLGQVECRVSVNYKFARTMYSCPFCGQGLHHIHRRCR